MKVQALAIPEIKLLTPSVFTDARGIFFESFSQRGWEAAIGETAFVQDNHSRSQQRVLRGLHYQLPPHAQGKLVRVAAGEVFDVAVDMRGGSPSFGKWVGTRLSAENHQLLWIPPGFAHGFLTLSPTADVLYKVSDYYAPECERSIRWDDPVLAIDWPLQGAPILSDKDRAAPLFRDATPFRE